MNDDVPPLIDGSLLDEMLFLLPTPDNGFFHFTSQLIKKYGIKAGETLRMSNLETAYKIVGNGLGAMFINAKDLNRACPELESRLAFCVLEEEPLERLSLIGYRKNGVNIDLINDLKKIISEKLFPAPG